MSRPFVPALTTWGPRGSWLASEACLGLFPRLRSAAGMSRTSSDRSERAVPNSSPRAAERARVRRSHLTVM